MQLKLILEAALLAVDRPLDLEELEKLFDEDERPTRDSLREALTELATDCEQRSVELRKIASGYRLQVREAYSPWVSRLFEEKPGRYSRAFLETLAIIAYRQPVTRGEIEAIRGVAVSSGIIRAMQERDWVHAVGYKEVPGKPALLATTRYFLDYFNLASLAELPPFPTFVENLDLSLTGHSETDESKTADEARPEAGNDEAP